MTILAQTRLWLVLGRVSNLPTVWSNCLAGWLLAGGKQLSSLLVVMCSASFFYVGGMLLNDAVDVEFDATYRSERPIPAGNVGRLAVSLAGIGLLASGMLIVSSMGSHTLWIATLLVMMICAYDAFHKRISFAPVLMGTCRWLLYLLAGSATGLVNFNVIAFGAMLGLYVTGLSFVARAESRFQKRMSCWNSLLITPIICALIIYHSIPSVVFSLVLIGGVVIARRSGRQSAGRAVSLLLAAIVLVDLLALSTTNYLVILTFGILLSVTLLLQKYIPAT